MPGAEGGPMNRGMRANAFRALPVALAVVLAAPGCARFRRPPVPAPPAMAEEVGADSPDVALPAETAGGPTNRIGWFWMRNRCCRCRPRCWWNNAKESRARGSGM